ncbi:DUF6701 domain-containing protein [Vibrio coralliirubri]|uniref:DUF6701 domain-containing protein n=1 Tax=Vibrio coralliirubri TaxID=1516159 RepID=UPI00073F88B5|nr:DUF6701 domain-containing protein [Vibrio coralliirubri]
MKHLSIIFALLFFSFPAFADFSSSQCSSLHAGDDFSVWFKLSPASGGDTIYATKRNGGSPTPIWSNDSGVRNPVIDDNETLNGEFYEVWLEYESSSNKSGWLTYNLWEGSSWRQVGSPQFADLSGLSAAIAVSGDGASEIQCDDDITQPPPSYVSQAQYQFGIAQCAGSECKIPLNKPFTNTPLVFVMPTIASNNPDLDAPASLMVTNVTKTEATIEQVKAPKNGWGPDLNSQPMTEVSYLAIEPGVADFNGHQVIAGYIETDEASAKFGSNDNDRVLYSDFGGGTFSSNPVVLHQIQTRNNSTKWMTSGKVKRTNERSYVDLFLELSASHNSNLDYEDEKIAFLATLPTNSNLAVDGYKVQFSRGYDTPSQNGDDPMLDGCEDKYATTSLTNVDGIIANKQERAGGHGGWLRRCNINNDQVSFVVDEDFRDRTHIPEEVGYFAFEIDDISIDICEIFPAPASSWKNNSQVTFNNAPNFPNGEPLKYFIGGWSGESCSPSESNCQDIRMGFDRLTDYSNYQYTCQTGTCVTGGEKVDASKLPSINFPELNGDVVFSNSRPDEIDQTGSCEAALVGDTCHPAGQGDGVININVDLNSLTLAYGGSDYPVEYRFPANKKVYIGNLTSNSSNVTLAVGANTYHYFKTLKFNSTNNTIKVSSKSAILIKDSLIFNSPADVNNDHVSDDLIFYGPEADATFNIASGAIVNAHILFDSIQFNNGGTIGGSVITNSLTIHDANTVILGQNSCYSPPASYQLDLSPNKDFSLLCETPQVTVTVTDSQGNPATEQVEVYITTPTGITVDSVIEGRHNGGNSYSTNSSGILTLGLDADSIGTYKIEAELASDSNQSDSGDFLVSLYKFEASDVYAIAGEDAEFTLKVLACKNDSVTPVSGYSGSKNLDISQFTLLKPSLSEGAQDGGLLVSGDGGTTWSNSSTTFDFTDAQASPNGKLNYDESGSVSFTLSDPDFECPTDYDCEDNEGGDLDSLEGVVNVFVRPWKIAICDIKEASVTTNSNPATTTGSPGFMASGENFSIKYRPIVFGSGDECNLDVTTNYALDSGPINVSFKLVYPNIVDDNLNITPAVVGPFDNSSELVISNYLWDEVGSVQFKTSATYLTMVLNEDTEIVGRFYPKYFTTIGTPIWDYPGGGVSEQSFAYMNQPFDGVEFEVEALNALGGALKNYASFDSTSVDLTAGFSLFEASFGNRFNSPVPNKQWALSGVRSIGTFTVVGSNSTNDCDAELCLEKLLTADNYEDGPYNGATGAVTDISITHTGSADDDPVAYLNEGGSRDPQRLTVQPDIRFGRMDLDDVGGNSGATITIPLRAEYWNGSRFVLNKDDNATNVAASTSASDVIWSENDSPTTTATLADGGPVSGGESRSLTASQGEGVNVREQVQLWQSMDDTPWLRYDWDSDKISDEENGEQDPSTVVTFGIYRGNDRVIYRGESGLTGQ